VVIRVQIARPSAPERSKSLIKSPDTGLDQQVEPLAVLPRLTDMRRAALGLATVLTIAACGMDSGATASTTTTSPTTTTTTSTTVPESFDKVDVAKRDLAEHLQIDVEDIDAGQLRVRHVE
jgi:hypothetical protein